MRRLQLDPVHRQLGATFTEELGWSIPEHYGDPEGEQRWVHRSAGLLDRSHRGVLDLRGPDVIGFLHGMVPSRARDLASMVGQRSCFLTPKGRIVDLFDLHRLEDGSARLVLDADLRPAFVEALGRYALLSDVALVDRSGDVAVLSLEGARSAGVLERCSGVERAPRADLERAGATLGGERVTVVRRGESPEGGFDLWVPRAALEAAWEELRGAVAAEGGGVIGLEAAEALRVEAGIPRHGKDCDDRSFLAEVGLDARASVDKCYVGQEVVARMRTYGHANRKLRGVVLEEGEAPEPGPGDELAVDGEPAGRVSSWARSVRLRRGVGLAMIERPSWDATEARAAGGARVELVDLPIVPPRVVDG